MFSLISFLKNFPRMKRWRRKELQLPVIIKRSFLSSYKWKKLFERHRQLRILPKQIFAEIISCFKSFSLNEYELRILSSVFLIEIFDLRGKELKYRKELLLNHYRNPCKILGCCRTCVGRVKTVVTNHLRKMFRSRIHKAAERNTAASRIHADELTEND